MHIACLGEGRNSEQIAHAVFSSALATLAPAALAPAFAPTLA
jgi:hypothetical protein